MWQWPGGILQHVARPGLAWCTHIMGAAVLQAFQVYGCVCTWNLTSQQSIERLVDRHNELACRRSVKPGAQGLEHADMLILAPPVGQFGKRCTFGTLMGREPFAALVPPPILKMHGSCQARSPLSPALRSQDLSSPTVFSTCCNIVLQFTNHLPSLSSFKPPQPCPDIPLLHDSANNAVWTANWHLLIAIYSGQSRTGRFGALCPRT